jgi:hypothetical protein
MTTPSTRRFRRTTLAATLVAGLTFVVAACAPDPGPAPDSTPVGPSLTTQDATTGVSPGTVITVRGQGYDPTGNVGTRPPLRNLPAGVYVVFACVTDPWRPSDGGVGANRQIIQQRWAVPWTEQYDAIGGADAGAVLMDTDGSFVVDLTLTDAACAGRYAVITYPGSGAAPNAAEELEIPITFTAAA